MTAALNSNVLCRCCHSEGTFKSLESRYAKDAEETYNTILVETFNIYVSISIALYRYFGVSRTKHEGLSNLRGDFIHFLQLAPSGESSICGICERRLSDALLFKRQVLSCEELFYNLKGIIQISMKPD